MPMIGILLVDDFEPIRLSLRSTVQRRVDWQIIGESADGLEAVELAKALQPDVILLDIGLPRLDGLTAAAQIRHLAPDANVLFVSQHASPDIIRAAFRSGARGY